MPPTTKEMVVSAFQDLVIAQDIAWVDKRSDAFQGVIADALQVLGIQEASLYKTKYLSMIPLPHKIIYATPFEPGVETEDFSLDAQLDTLSHEKTHKLDAVLEGVAAYGLQYGLRKTGRVHREMRANASMAEWYRARYGVEMDAVRMADGMRYYGCTAEIQFAEIEMRSMLLTVNAGGVVGGLGGEEMIRWALAKFPELIALNPFA